jgi:hypothetical protein
VIDVRSTWTEQNEAKHMPHDGLMDTRCFAGKEPNWFYLFTSCTTSPSASAYLAAETGGDQGGHDDHGDHDLDGGRDVSCSHLGCLLCLLMLLVPKLNVQSKSLECVPRSRVQKSRSCEYLDQCGSTFL